MFGQLQKLVSVVRAAYGRVRSVFGSDGAPSSPAEGGGKTAKVSALQRARLVLAAAIAANFQNQTTPDGTAWLPIQRRQPPPPLDVTGTMKLAAIEAARTATVTDAGLVASLTTPFYAKYQDRDREFFGVSEAVAEALAEDVGVDMLVFIIDGRRK